MESVSYKFIFPDHIKMDMEYGRSTLARCLDGLPNAHKMFHYDEKGKPLPGGFPRVRTWSNNNRIEILAIGKEMIDIAEGFMPNIIFGFTRRFGVMPSIQVTKNNIDVEYSQEPFFYVANSMVIDRDLKACETFEKKDDASRFEKIHKVLISGLERQANEFGLKLPSEMPSIHGLQVLKYHPRAKLVFDGDDVLQHGPAVNLGFFWNAKVSGHGVWAA